MLARLDRQIVALLGAAAACSACGTAGSPVSDAGPPRDVSFAADTPAPVDLSVDVGADAGEALDAPIDAPPAASSGALGAAEDPDGRTLHFRVYSARATRIELSVFARPAGADAALRVVLVPVGTTGVWSVTVTREALALAGVTGTVYYGYRAWGPNWPYDPAWTPGSALGFVADFEEAGNRFNPNKLLFDPYARELSHDPVTPSSRDGAVYRTGSAARARDCAPSAPKGIVLASDAADGAGGR